MRAAIRLAERRGKLTGDLSRVQEFALTILMWKEDQDQADALANARIDQVKMALIASQATTMEQMFPEYLPSDDHGGEIQSDIPISEAQRIEDLLMDGGVLRFTDIEER